MSSEVTDNDCWNTISENLWNPPTDGCWETNLRVFCKAFVWSYIGTYVCLTIYNYMAA